MKRFLLLLALLSPSVHAIDLATAQQALKIISDFADDFCKTPPLEGGTQGTELSISAKAELSEVLKKVANLGVEVAAKYQTEHYQGLLQKDLVNVLRDSSDCRREVWHDLKDKLLPDKPPASPPPPASRKVIAPDQMAKQWALIKRATQAEEENRRLQETARLAKAETDAEAAMRSFAIHNNYPVFDPTPGQLRTLAILFREQARAEEIDAYLELMVAGIGLVIVEDYPGALRRTRSVLDAAAQISANSNVGIAIAGDTRKERMKSFAAAIRRSSPLSSDQVVEDFRSQVLRYPSLSLR